ncbi:MAG: DUF1207 domain-containing protein [Rhizobacter sp.]|nr:DUF1207 domain-containing protein [Chlorobiales bacterium]
MRFTSLFIAALFILQPCSSQTAVAQIAASQADSSVSPQVRFTSGNRALFSPLVADPKEPRFAVLNVLAGNQLLLDIGGTIDLVRVNFQSPSPTEAQHAAAFGADFGTFTLLRKENDFKFPVEAIDYIFGINVSYRQPVVIFSEKVSVSARLRLSHISAHFVDGHYDGDNQEWRDAKPPFVFSREFFNFVVAVEGGREAIGGRIYLGYEWIFHTLPNGFGTSVLQTGAEVYSNEFLAGAVTPFAATDLRLLSLGEAGRNAGGGDATTGMFSVQAGIKTGAMRGRGLRIAVNYQSGLDIHGMYFYRRIEQWSLGLVIDL